MRTLGDRRRRLGAIGEGTVTVDPQRVTQAMAQLAHNAVQHTEAGQEILIGSSLHHGRVSFWITDHGPGVAPADAKVIFERFSRGSTGGKRGIFQRPQFPTIDPKVTQGVVATILVVDFLLSVGWTGWSSYRANRTVDVLSTVTPSRYLNVPPDGHTQGNVMIAQCHL